MKKLIDTSYVGLKEKRTAALRRRNGLVRGKIRAEGIPAVRFAAGRGLCLLSAGTAGEKNAAYASRPADFSCRRKRLIPADGDRMSHSDAFDPIGAGGGIFRRLRTAEFGPQIRLIKRRRPSKREAIRRRCEHGAAVRHIRMSAGRSVQAKEGTICIFGTERRDVPCASCRRFQKRPLCLRRAGPAYRRAQVVRPAFLPRYR